MIKPQETIEHKDAPELAAYGLTKSFGQVSVLSDLTLEVVKGEALGIIGPSGSGKSTLLRCLTLLDTVQSGEIRFRGQRMALGPSIETDEDAYRRRVGLVFQEFNLWSNKTILENVIEAPIYVLGHSKREARHIGEEWIRRVGLSGHERKYPNELSGGQRQRAALARAFAMDPEILLLDEITSALDVSTTARLLNLIRELRTPDRTFIFVTHHLTFAEQHMDRVAVLADGTVVEHGPAASILRNPQAEATKKFLNIVKESW
jgi:ABC-type polar amino acid transport system ATPase subunit